MAQHKRTEIVLESDQVLIIQRRRSIRARRQECGREVDMVGLVEAEVPTGVTGPALRIHVEARAWHVFQGECGISSVWSHG